jgi:hypothetical protein
MFGLISDPAITPTHTMHRQTNTQTFLAEAATAVAVACGPLSPAERLYGDAPALAGRHAS